MLHGGKKPRSFDRKVIGMAPKGVIEREHAEPSRFEAAKHEQAPVGSEDVHRYERGGILAPSFLGDVEDPGDRTRVEQDQLLTPFERGVRYAFHLAVPILTEHAVESAGGVGIGGKPDANEERNHRLIGYQRTHAKDIHFELADPLHVLGEDPIERVSPIVARFFKVGWYEEAERCQHMA